MDAMTLGGFLRGAACCFLQKGSNLSIGIHRVDVTRDEKRTTPGRARNKTSLPVIISSLRKDLDVGS
jgi:hypothetical protein